MVSEEDHPEVTNSKGCSGELVVGVDQCEGAEAWIPGEAEVNQDELIRQQMKDIDDVICREIPLIGDKISLHSLMEEYDEDQVYRAKILDLQRTYQSMRKTRPDGNCFFRAYGFSLFHSLVVNKDHSEVERLLQVASDVQEDLIEQLGYASSVIDDLMEPFVAVLQEIKEGTVKTSEDVRSVFNNASRSDYIVVFLRLVTSCHLQKNSEFFSAFMEDGITIKDFCKSEVEPMYKESDHIHIIAITETMKLGVRINYLDRGGSATKVNVHDFPEGIANPSIHLLYRPGHYDVLYDQGLEDVPLNSNELVVHNHVLRDNETESSEQLSDDQMPSSSNSTNGVKHGRVVSSTDSSSTSTVPEDNGVSSSKAVKLDPTLTRSSVSSSTSSFVFSNGGSVKAQESNEASTTS